MQTIPFSIQQIIEMARAKQLVVPEFQRDFVWNEAQVRKLVDSVSSLAQFHRQALTLVREPTGGLSRSA